MPDIKLGLSGSEATLPATVSMSLPISYPKQIEKQIMSDGSARYAFFKKGRVWSLVWPGLTQAQLDALIVLYDHNSLLRFQNNYESATWHWVVFMNLRYDSVDPISATNLYVVEILIEESV
ncbi:hypothetical protein LCGC14_2180510 [marine sediment metagenome]|uniref:Phage minor tail protein n=1 Tax=marine sediment metagenome TaxID=412755 RepID=A0A0F9GIC3_9ZZZZ